MPSLSLSYLRPEVQALKEKLDSFVENECIPAETQYQQHLQSRYGNDRWTIEAIPPCMERLKVRAKELGLWNLFIPPHLLAKLPARDDDDNDNDPSRLAPSIALTYREYGVLCESLGRSFVAPEACNTSAPDTGNMEVLLEFGTKSQQEKYLLPLLRGEMRSTFAMTEPNVTSSDPTNLETRLVKRQSTTTTETGQAEYVLTGRKWWSTGALDPRCRLALVVAKLHDETITNEYRNNSSNSGNSDNHHHQNNKHGAHTIVAIPLPHPQVRLTRVLTVFGYDDAPHGHAQMEFNGVIVTLNDLILGESSGFAVAQARLGPGRIHHCMRAVAARSYELMLQRSLERQAFGKYLHEHGMVQQQIADSRADLTAARLLTLSCAAAMDEIGPKQARDQISMIKYTVPMLTYRVVDRALQVFGGAGVSDDTVLARILVGLRSLRIADGPDEVHKRTVARLEVAKAKKKLQSRL